MVMLYAGVFGYIVFLSAGLPVACWSSIGLLNAFNSKGLEVIWLDVETFNLAPSYYLSLFKKYFLLSL